MATKRGPQDDTIRRAAEAPSFEVVRMLWQLLESHPDTELDPRWRTIWGRVRDEVIREHEAPPHVIEKVERSVSAIEVIDKALSEIKLRPEDDVSLLLGAGASAPEPSSIPTVLELLPELWRRARKLGRDDIDRLAGWCDEHDVTNIEDLLTAAYLANFAAKSPSVSGLLEYFLFKERLAADTRLRGRFRTAVRPTSQIDAASVALFQETLQGLFGLLTSTMIPAPPNPGHAAVVEFVRAHPNSAVVTTNYDGCIDEALVNAKVAFRTHIADTEEGPPAALDLIKMHGSINWTYCDSCHQVREFNLSALKKSFEADTFSYAVVGICRNCGGQRRPLLIPPMGLKFVIFPSLIRLWNLARERIERAKVIVVVGFSFSEADSYIAKIIERSMSFHRNQKLVVCDPNERLVPTLRERYGARIEGFEKTRIISALGSADRMLAQILPQLISAQGSSALSEQQLEKPHRGERSRSATPRTATSEELE